MEDNKRKLVIGALVHDIGKILYREETIANHSKMGYEFLKETINFDDKDILDQVLYHHSDMIKYSNLENNSLAYITYIADNIASKIDRRKITDENVKKSDVPFSRNKPLSSIFNKLNNNDNDKCYVAGTLDKKEGIKYPTENKNIEYDESFYNEIRVRLTECLKQIKNDESNVNEEYLNSLLEVLENQTSYIPSSTSNSELADISLFDHLKITAAYAVSIYDYLKENNITDYKNELYINGENFYDKKAFQIVCLDFSGIQDYIYTMGDVGEGMLKSLRVRSFYLEILMENIIDELLNKLELTRVNMIYAGGGHSYLLFANTENIKNIIDNYIKEINIWLLDNFKTKLYLSYGYNECSANDLSGEDENKYIKVFSGIQAKISNNKMHKFSASEILKLNNDNVYNEGENVLYAKKTTDLNEDNHCPICASIINMSNVILDENKYLFVVLNNITDKIILNNSLPLPYEKRLYVCNETECKELLNMDLTKRVYCKNKPYTGKNIAKRFWYCDYVKNGLKTFEDLANASYGGYKKLAVLRADVDNLGKTFVNGFNHKKYGRKLMTLSRTATLSRKLSEFFKSDITYILKNPVKYYVVDKTEFLNAFGRDIAIIYSGGDDIFAVGAWDEVINFAIDLYENFKNFTDGTLSFSCGIGMYDHSLPIYNMANFAGNLEDASKSYVYKSGNVEKSKNAITLFDDINNENTYNFEEFINEVLSNKYETIKTYFENSNDKGRSFLYKLLELVENSDKKINIVRLAYVLARAKPDAKNCEEVQKEKDKKLRNEIIAEKEKEFNDFSNNIITWIKNKNDKKQLLTALRLYGYYSRED